jgi:ribosomal-protein-alanine N-acetyltransferase
MAAQALSAKMKPPETFELPHLRLRRPLSSDAEAVFEYGSDPEVARFADWPVRTSIDGLAESLLARAARWDAGEDFYWIFTRADDDRAIGGISCQITGDSAEIGFLLARRHWGKGWATDATKAVAGWARSCLALNRLHATCDAENLASARVLEKAGFSLECRLPRAVIRPNLSPDPRDALMFSLALR